jgi:hypothetical protein
MTNCSFCNEPGHNIRTCRDIRIRSGIKELIAKYVIPKIGFQFSQEDCSQVFNYLCFTLPRRLLYAIGIHYCGTRLNSIIQIHARDIVDQLRIDLDTANTMMDTELDEWCMGMIGMTYTEYTETFNPVYHHQEPLVMYPSFKIVLNEQLERTDTMVECVICQEEKTTTHFDKTQCGHSFCHSCTCSLLLSKGADRANCPLCRAEIMALETATPDNYNELDLHFSLTGVLLKNSSVLAFGEPIWHRISFEHTIEMFRYEYADNMELSERIKNGRDHLDQAEIIWEFLCNSR